MAPTNRTDAARPDPDALLAALRRETAGRLKVFLGAAPGVGKTYAMLQNARRLKNEGVDVVIGLVENSWPRRDERARRRARDPAAAQD